MLTSSPTTFYHKLSHSLVIISFTILLLYLGRHILIPFAFGTLFAIILVAPCRFLENLKIPRGLAALLLVILLIFSGLVIAYFISQQLVNLKNDLTLMTNQLTGSMNNIETRVQQSFHISNDSMQAFLHSITSQILSETHLLFTSTVNMVSGTVVLLVLIPVYSFLLLYYRSLLGRFLVNSFPEEHALQVQLVLNKIQYVTRRYISGLFIELLIVATLNCLGFVIVGVKYALLLAVIAALFNLIPYLGIFLAFILSMLVTLSTDTPATTLGVAIILITVHLTDANFIMPFVVGTRAKINALVTILGIVTGSAIWGIPGMFLAIPFLAILKVIFDEVDILRPWGLVLGEDTTTAKTGLRRLWKRMATPDKS